MIEARHKLQAIEILKKERDALKQKASMLQVVIAGIKSVSHHAKITSRMTDAIKELLGDKYQIVYSREHSNKLNIWGNGLNYDQRLTIYGETFAELISALETAIKNGDYSTVAIDKTLACLEQGDAGEGLLQIVRDVQRRIEVEMPALHYLRAVRPYEQLYDAQNVHISK